ncbi:hypothetical protein M2407_005143 [Serratia sp. BIGb0234]|nr:hypothetical protein [Serratia sp. BIGb0234]
MNIFARYLKKKNVVSAVFKLFIMFLVFFNVLLFTLALGAVLYLCLFIEIRSFVTQCLLPILERAGWVS